MAKIRAGMAHSLADGVEWPWWLGRAELERAIERLWCEVSRDPPSEGFVQHCCDAMSSCRVPQALATGAWRFILKLEKTG